jgi:gliding motility-associated-like protein
MMSFKHTLLLTVLIFSVSASAQVYTLDFSACAYTHPLGNSTANGTPDCQCGVLNEALSFDGIDDGLLLPDTLINFLREDFTIDFYINLKNKGNNQVDILSIGNDCGIDSLITIKYVQNTKEILVELFINNGIYFPIKAILPSVLCWNRVTLVKSKLNYSLYINNEKKEVAIASQTIPLPKRAKIALSNSPCLATTDGRFEGNIDELNIYNRALAEREIFQSYNFPERILSNDTTVFAGSSINIEFGNTCATTFLWTPSNSLDEDDQKNVIATPDVTTIYQVTATGDNCTSKDSITIYVLDPEKQNCTNLLLPNAFTPNEDKVNDIFEISNPFLIEQMEAFEILDRWGEILFKTTDKNEGWDGYFLSKRAEPGLYVYRINYQCKGELYNKLGNFVLIK